MSFPNDLFYFSAHCFPFCGSCYTSCEGSAYCAPTHDKNIFLAYFEKGCSQAEIRGAKLNSAYRAEWFNARNGTWIDVGNGKLLASKIGVIKLPKLPEDLDWGLKLVYEQPEAKKLSNKKIRQWKDEVNLL